MNTISSCKCNNITHNISVCNSSCSPAERSQCNRYNHNLALNKTILETACEKSEDKFRKDASSIQCHKDNCPNHANCTKVLSPNIALSDQPLIYSEFSGYTSVIAPNYITIDLHTLVDVQTIQFLLWDNRGNNKQEACNREHHYRLLISDYAGDLENNDWGDLSPKNREDQLSWTVVYDSLRLGYNGWQVFNFNKKTNIRYIRLHFISNSDHKICNIVRFEAYTETLIGYNYNFLPTFETTIYLDHSATNKNDSISSNSINKFTREILSSLEKKITFNKNEGALDLANDIILFKNDLQSVIDELDIYESRVNEVKSSIFRSTNLILHRAQIIKYISIILGIIGFIFSFK